MCTLSFKSCLEGCLRLDCVSKASRIYFSGHIFSYCENDRVLEPTVDPQELMVGIFAAPKVLDSRILTMGFSLSLRNRV